MMNILEAFHPFESFSKALLDGYVLLDHKGHIQKSNQLFSIMLGISGKQVLKATSLDELLTLSINGVQLSARELLEKKNPSRIDEVTGQVPNMPPFNLILGLYPFFHNETYIGLFLLIRDVTAETNLQGKYKDKATQSITDRLTGLYNRTYFDNYLEKVVHTFEREKNHKVSVLMGDVDHFKNVNDTYGHQAGDYVLSEVSNLFRQSFRKTDILCRYGGEEFLAILPATDLNGALLVAEKFRSKVAEYPFVFSGQRMPISISLGAAQMRLEEETPTQTVTRADESLYFSKEHGRNQVSFHDGKQIQAIKKSTEAK